MACKDCIHFGICQLGYPWADGKGGGWCQDFKDKFRYIELPCKIGDFVWFIGYEMSECTHCGTSDDEFICEKCEFECDRTEIWSVSMTKATSLEWFLPRLKDFGTVYFTTKEEAEKALAARNKK